jgi:hypothetical protein
MNKVNFFIKHFPMIHFFVL